MNQPANIQPPKLFLRFFRWFCDPSMAEDIEGDLQEMFQRKAEAGNISQARLQFSFNVLKLFRPGIIKKFGKQSSFIQPSPMFKNYFITAVRSLMRNKGFTAINIVGLAVGLATFSLISFYVYHELSFDRYHKNADRIFRIVENLRTENEMLLQSTSSPPMGPRMLKDFPEVESYVRLQNWNLLADRNGISYYEPDSYVVDSTVFDVFSFNLIQGDQKTALRDPNSIVLTKSMAKKYFQEDENPLGQFIKMDYDSYKVTGVMEDVPENSHFKFTNLISWSTWSKDNKRAEDGAWFWNGFHTYLLLRDEQSADKVRSKMPDFISRNVEKGGMYYEDLPLQALTEIYLAPQRSWENGTRGSKNNIYILSIIAVFILLIACFNYINLATARASRRLKEVGLRKSLGALRRMLVAQFLGESIIVAFLSGFLAVLFAWLALPSFRILVESPLSLSLLPSPWLIVGTAFILIIFIGILAGGYPAFVISGFQPLQVFRPSIKTFYSNTNFRKVLVAFQFIISITLVSGTLLMYDQLDLVRNQDLGFNKNATLVVNTNGDTAIVRHLDAIKNELKTVPGVLAVTGSRSVPGGVVNNLYTEIEMLDGKMSGTNINYNFVDHDFISAYDIKIIAGRDFSRDTKADDTTAYLINETGVKDFGWTPEQAIGKKMGRAAQGSRIVGVVKDFNYRSLHSNVEPLMIGMTNYVGRLSIRIEENEIPATVARVQKKWTELMPYLPFDYSFLDVSYDNQYKADRQLGKVASVFTGLAIIIGCLGLLGLTSFAVERRTKEIGIRKVLGASVTNVIILIAREFVLLIAVALVLATPITWYFIARWEQNFTLQAVINPAQFFVAGVAVFAFAWATISFLSFRAATANPTEALRTE